MMRHQILLTILVQTVVFISTFFTGKDTSAAQTIEIFPLHIETQPFNSMMCKKIRPEENIRVRVANHLDLILRTIPNQIMPQQFEDARKKSYVRYLNFHDLTNGEIDQGGIAFDTKHAVIFTDEHPQGISREEFVSQLSRPQVAIANQGLNTFLRLHPILNAAIDGCRPYPSHITYGTDDEFDKIETGRMTYRALTQQYNVHPSQNRTLIRHESGTSGGFYDPRMEGKRASYQAMNPLNFYRVSALYQ